MILVDTGPLVAAANRKDDDHSRCVELLAQSRPPRLVPGPVIAEVGYLLARDAGPVPEAAFLRTFQTRFLSVVETTASDLTRAADLVERYTNLPLGTTDACVVAIAERLGLRELATLDHRHFGVVRPSHVKAFTLLP